MLLPAFRRFIPCSGCSPCFLSLTAQGAERRAGAQPRTGPSAGREGGFARPSPSSSAGRAERLGASSLKVWQRELLPAEDGVGINCVTLEKSSLGHGVLHFSLQNVGDLINLRVDVPAERYISRCIYISFSVFIRLNCKSS